MSRTDEVAIADAWLTASKKGFQELSCGRVAIALDCWREAAQALGVSDATDPRLAAAKNNAGVACLLLRHETHAAVLLNEALNVWEQVCDRVDTMDVPVAGLSSTFHLRLAIHHSEAFREAVRKRYEQQCDAALAITRFNVRLAEGRLYEADQFVTMIERLTKSFGPGCPEISVLKSLSGSRDNALPNGANQRTAAQLFGTYGEKLSRGLASEQDSRESSPPTEAQKLELAARMTALCDPRLRAEHPPHNNELNR